MTLVHKSQTYPLKSGCTKLQKTDYSFLQRFIDATKANLFFARGIMMVEGPAEAILLPTLAEACGRSFSKHGVSLVNVGHTGLYHYARILQREGTGPQYPVPAVCLTDRDIVPDVANTYVPKPAKGKRFEADYDEAGIKAVVDRKIARAEGGNTIVCVSDRWTLEYDLARHGCAKLMHVAIALAIVASSKDERLSEADEKAAITAALTTWVILEAAGHSPDKLASIIYRPLYEKEASKAITAQYAAHLLSTGGYGAGEELFNRLPPYLQRALNHLTTASATAPKAAKPASASLTAAPLPGTTSGALIASAPAQPAPAGVPTP
jgi:putative ATP-dependent endonuclease of OLD family